MKILDGKKIASEIKEEFKADISLLAEKGIVPGLAVIICGKDEASKIYVANKEKMAKELGIRSWVYEFGEDVSREELLGIIEKLNEEEAVSGILVQLPLPSHIDEGEILAAINPKKDVDCFHPENVGKVATGGAMFLPCTPLGIMELLKRSGIEIAGKECVVVGRSNIVGKPLALMLLEEDATITVSHSKTKNLKEVCLRADILVLAVGKKNLIDASMVKEGAVIVDVGINRLPNGKLVGDVDFEEVKEKASAITPVPGGVGPMTIMMLMRNTILAAKLANKNK